MPQGEAGRQEAKFELTGSPTTGPERTSAHREGHSDHKGAREHHSKPERPRAGGLPAQGPGRGQRASRAEKGRLGHQWTQFSP